MNRIEALYIRMGRNSRWGTHNSGFDWDLVRRVESRKLSPAESKITPKMQKELDEVTAGELKYPNPKTGIKILL